MESSKLGMEKAAELLDAMEVEMTAAHNALRGGRAQDYMRHFDNYQRMRSTLLTGYTEEERDTEEVDAVSVAIDKLRVVSALRDSSGHRTYYASALSYMFAVGAQWQKNRDKA